MSRTIFCTFLQREADGQDFQLYPGELGKRIYNEISKEAWAAEKTRPAFRLSTVATSAPRGPPVRPMAAALSYTRVRYLHRALVATVESRNAGLVFSAIKED
jgi:hypothetical protein